MVSEKCAMCDGKMKRGIVPYSVYGMEIGKFPAMVCSKCGEQWFDEKTARKIEEIEKSKNLFGLSKETKISYSGNSLILRIPRKIAKFLNLKKEEPVLIYPESRNKLGVSLL